MLPHNRHDYAESLDPGRRPTWFWLFAECGFTLAIAIVIAWSLFGFLTGG